MKDQTRRRLQGSVNYWTNATEALRQRGLNQCNSLELADQAGNTNETARQQLTRTLDRYAICEQRLANAQARLTEYDQQLHNADPHAFQIRNITNAQAAIAHHKRAIERTTHLLAQADKLTPTAQAHYQQKLERSQANLTRHTQRLAQLRQQKDDNHGTT